MKLKKVIILIIILIFTLTSCKNARLGIDDFSVDQTMLEVSVESITESVVEAVSEREITYDETLTFSVSDSSLLDDTMVVLEKRIGVITEIYNVFASEGNIVVSYSDEFDDVDVSKFLSAKGDVYVCDNNENIIINKSNIISAENKFAELSSDGILDNFIELSIDNTAQELFNIAVSKLKTTGVFKIYVDGEVVSDPEVDPDTVFSGNTMIVNFEDEISKCATLTSLMTTTLPTEITEITE